MTFYESRDKYVRPGRKLDTAHRQGLLIIMQPPIKALKPSK